jgi:hypothetical protein
LLLQDVKPTTDDNKVKSKRPEVIRFFMVDYVWLLPKARLKSYGLP